MRLFVYRLQDAWLAQVRAHLDRAGALVCVVCEFCKDGERAGYGLSPIQHRCQFIPANPKLGGSTRLGYWPSELMRGGDEDAKEEV